MATNKLNTAIQREEARLMLLDKNIRLLGSKIAGTTIISMIDRHVEELQKWSNKKKSTIEQLANLRKEKWLESRDN